MSTDEHHFTIKEKSNKDGGLDVTMSVQPTPDSEPLYSNAVHTPEMWEKIGRFLGKIKAKDVKKWAGSNGTN